ncbi:unnamed protein product [Trichobilharzia szidati]|nr:unnamed protein product [Trichobilharzia szidati]
MDMAQVNACRYLCQPFYCEDDAPILYGSSSGSGSGSIGSTVSSGSLNSSGWSNMLSIPNFSTSSSSSSRNRMDTLHVQTLVCSNYHTTDENLTKVLLWRNYQEDIIMCLRQGIYLSRKDNELRKFTRSLIDSMLQLLQTTMDEDLQRITNLNLGYSLLMGLARCYKDLTIDSYRQQLILRYLNGSGFIYNKIYIPYLQLLNAMLCEIISPVLYQNHPNPPSVTAASVPLHSTGRSKLDHQMGNNRNGVGSGGGGGGAAAAGITNYSTPQFFDIKAVQLIFSTIHWAFLIIVRSRQLDIMQLNGHSQKETEFLFIRQVESFLSGIIDVTCHTEDVLLRLIIFKHVPEIVKCLTEVYPKLKLSQFIVRLITRTLESTELPSQKILTETIHSSLFTDAQCRHLLVPTIQSSLTHVFTEKLDKVLNSKNNENTAIMDVWCDVLLSFVDSFTKATDVSSDNHRHKEEEEPEQEQEDDNSETASKTSLTPTRKSSSTVVIDSSTSFYNDKSDEIFNLLIKRDFLRWTMQQLSRILIFIHQRNSTLYCQPMNCDSFAVVVAGGGSASNSSSCCSSGGATLPSVNKLSPSKPPIHPSYHRLQPIMGCLSTVLFSLLRLLTKSSWIKFLDSVYETEESCRCSYCHNLQLVGIYDFLHELFNLFCLMHLYPAYPSPMFRSRSDRIWAVGRYSWEDGSYADDRRSENYDQKLISSSLSSPQQNNLSNISSINQHNNAELFSQSWIEMLALISNSELDVIEVLIELAIKPFFLDSKLDNKFLLHSTQSSSSSSTTAVCQVEQCLSTDIIELLAQCLTGFAVEQAHLCVEALPPVTRTRIDQSLTNHHSIDMRQRACNLLLSLWHSIDDRSKTNYIQIFLPNVINMATLPLPKIREMCVDCILSALTIHSSTVEHVFVSEIDRVVQWAGTDFAADIRDLLQSRLLNSKNSLQTLQRTTAHTAPEDVHLDHRQRVVNDFSKQIDCLLHYGKFINHPSQMNEMLAFCNLRKFYESINRKDMILRYLYRLDRLHAAYSNKTERGYTLELISENYSWDETSVDVSDVSPHYVQYGQNSSRELRERLLLDSFEYLKQGTDWEHAIEISNKLVHLYRDVMPNYERLSEILQEQAHLYQHIVSSEQSRLPFRYYLIEFYGPASSLITTNRKLIYRTVSDLGDVLNMLTEQFPDAIILNQPLTTNNQSSVAADKFCIFASGNLEPESEIPEHLDSRVVDNKIKSYYSKNRVKYFLRHRPLQPTEKKDGRLVTNTEETRYCITETMPNIIPIMPVDRVEIRMLSQTEWANKQIQGIIKALHADLVSAKSQESNISQYIGKLVSSIQSPVSGGVPKLVKDVELSDDPRQEKCFSQLADSVLELLELQLTFLKFWYTADPPPPPASHRLIAMRNLDMVENTSGSNVVSSVSGAAGTGNYLLYEMIGYYEVLVRDMSRKFGFSVDHLNADSLRYGPISTDRQGTVSGISNNNTNILSPLRRNSRSSQNAMNTSVGTITQSTMPRVFSRPDYSGFEHSTIRSLQRSFQTSGSGRTPLESITFSTSTNKSNSFFNILSADPPPLPDRPLLTKPVIQTKIPSSTSDTTTGISSNGSRPTSLTTNNNSGSNVSGSYGDSSSGSNTCKSDTGASSHEYSSTPRGRTITPDEDSHNHYTSNNTDNGKRQLTNPSNIISRIESSPNVIRSRSRPLPPLPPTPVRSSSITRTENVNTRSKQMSVTSSGNLTNNESAPPLPERKSKVSCPSMTPIVQSPGRRNHDDSSFDFT